MVQLLSHGGYSVFAPRKMVEDNKRIFKEILEKFLKEYNFNEALFSNE